MDSNSMNLVNAGSQLANIAYNLAQRAGEPLTQHEASLLDAACKQWDEARHALAAPAAPVTQNPHTGAACDKRDIASDPQAVLCVEPGVPLRAAAQPAVVLDEAVIRMLASASGELDGDDADWCFTDAALIAFANNIAAQPAPADAVALPTNADQAALMALLGTQWLEQHAPERLKASADAGQAQACSPKPVTNEHQEGLTAKNGEEALADAEPSAQEQKLAERVNWTTKQWYEHVGAREDDKDQIIFGTVMALWAMLVQFQAVTLHAAERRATQPAQCAAPDERAAFEREFRNDIGAKDSDDLTHVFGHSWAWKWWSKAHASLAPAPDQHADSDFASMSVWEQSIFMRGVNRGRAAPAFQAQPVAAQQTIDTPEFSEKLANAQEAHEAGEEAYMDARAALIAHINLWGHGRYIRGYDKRKAEEIAPPAPAAQPEAKAAPVDALSDSEIKMLAYKAGIGSSAALRFAALLAAAGNSQGQAAQPAQGTSELRAGIASNQSYWNGMQQGWRLCAAGDVEKFHAELNAVKAEIAPARAELQASQPEQQPDDTAACLPPIELDSIATFSSLHGTLIRRADVECMLARLRPTAHAAPVPAAAPEPLQGCEWTHDEPQYSWDSACGEKWSFIEGGPKENFVRFCQGCGKPVVLAAAPVGGA